MIAARQADNAIVRRDVEEVRRSSETAAERIHDIAELIDSYVRRLLAPAAGGNAVQLPIWRR
jgi:hypothetical protein